MSKRRSLMPHQVDAFKWAAPRRNAALFMEMRLGKSLVAARWARIHQKDGVCVICPMEVVRPWQRELRQEGIEPIALAYDKPDKRYVNACSHLNSGERWFITNIESLRGELSCVDWGTVILDESTVIKNPTAKVSKTLTKPRRPGQRRMILSGLPNPEGPENFVNQMLYVTHNDFMNCRSFWGWRAKYMQPAAFGWGLKRGVAKDLMNEVRERSFFLSRKQAGIGSCKIYEQRYVQASSATKRQLKELFSTFSLGDNYETMFKPVVDSLAWRLLGGTLDRYQHAAKFKELNHLLTGELKNEKVVVWFRYNDEIRAADRYLDSNVSAATVVGASHDRRLREMQNEGLKLFKEARHPRVLLVQEKAMRYGEDLSAASAAIYFSSYPSLELRKQTEDRIVTVHDDEPRLIIDLITEDTIEEDQYDATFDKVMTAKAFTSNFCRRVRERMAA